MYFCIHVRRELSLGKKVQLIEDSDVIPRYFLCVFICWNLLA